MIKYDSEYRKAQAEAGFPFRADSSFMMQVFLRDRLAVEAKPPHQPNSTPHPQTKFDPRSGKPIGGRFNTSIGCKLPQCKMPMSAACAIAHTASLATRIRPQLAPTPLSQITPVKGTLATLPSTPYATFTCMGEVPLE